MFLNRSKFYFFVFGLFFFSSVFYTGTACAQRKKGHEKDSLDQNTPDYFKENYLRAEDYVYKPNIKTVLFYRDGFELTAPIMNLNEDIKLILKFDDLDAEYKRMKYTFIHCDANWKQSDLMPNEYLTGFYEDDITDYKFSNNTIQKYIHYTLSIPGERMQPTLSGNYLLKVYMEDSPDDVVLTRRFMIADQKVDIKAVIKQPQDVEYRNYKQEVDFTIDKTGYLVNNPYQDLKVIIQQNGRWDNALYDLKPLFINGDVLDFTNQEANVFSGGNIFRWFDIKAMTFYSEFIRKIDRDSAGFEVWLKDEERKTFKVFASQKDIKGKKFIKSDDHVTDSNIESEYVHVHFFLRYPAPLTSGNIYIMGALTDWNFIKEAKMTYNYDKKGYEANLYLKQGYYNYQYVYLENSSKPGDETLVEGMHWETDNEYTIYVYNREQGSLYDVLVGVKQFNSFSK